MTTDRATFSIFLVSPERCPQKGVPRKGATLTALEFRAAPTRRRLIVLGGVILANYLVQIPYQFHLYGGLRFGPTVWSVGIILSFAAFVVGLAGALRRSRVGYWFLFFFVTAEFLFYFRNETIGIPHGYGLPYHLLHVSDPLLWFVFFIGGINFVVDGYFLWYLSQHRPPWIGAHSSIDPSRLQAFEHETDGISEAVALA